MNIADEYNRQGFVSNVPLLSSADADQHRNAFENAEQQCKRELGSLHYFNKMHLFLKSPLQLATMPAVLDIVQQMIGDDILLYNCTYIIKEPHSQSFVSWHQDLTYWGLSDENQVSMWLALTPATAENGCMRMIPESHKGGMAEHTATHDENNVLDLGQTVREVDEAAAVVCSLKAGEASFHHGWTLHASAPNTTEMRRIGLNVQYISTKTRQIKQNDDTAMLVRGQDNHGYYKPDKIISDTITPANISALIAYRQKFTETYKL